MSPFFPAARHQESCRGYKSSPIPNIQDGRLIQDEEGRG